MSLSRDHEPVTQDNLDQGSQTLGEAAFPQKVERTQSSQSLLRTVLQNMNGSSENRLLLPSPCCRRPGRASSHIAETQYGLKMLISRG